MTRGQALRFGALLHDIAKPQTRGMTDEGRVTFMGHDRAGAELATSILRRLRASEKLSGYVAALTLHHLRLGFLVHREPLSRRDVYDYLLTCSPVGVDVTLLSVADRLATRGDNSERAIARHLALARTMLPEALAWEANPPRPPVRGDELARALGIAPGPQVGGLLGRAAGGGVQRRGPHARAGDRPRPPAGRGSIVEATKLDAMRDPDCLFCKIVAGELPSQQVDADERTVAFMDISPATRGHALVVPRNHATNLLEADPEDVAAVAVAAQRLAGRVTERLGADGVNLINSCGAAAWQTVFHLHMHVIPRYADDPLKLPWVPSQGDAGEIAATAELLR